MTKYAAKTEKSAFVYYSNKHDLFPSNSPASPKYFNVKASQP